MGEMYHCIERWRDSCPFASVLACLNIKYGLARGWRPMRIFVAKDRATFTWYCLWESVGSWGWWYLSIIITWPWLVVDRATFVIIFAWSSTSRSSINVMSSNVRKQSKNEWFVFKETISAGTAAQRVRSACSCCKCCDRLLTSQSVQFPSSYYHNVTCVLVIHPKEPNMICRALAQQTTTRSQAATTVYPWNEYHKWKITSRNAIMIGDVPW